MKKYSKEDIILSIKDNDVRYIRLQFTDMLGMILEPMFQLGK